MSAKLYFLTGNAGKLREVQELIPDVESMDIDLPEIQDLDPHKIILAKLEAALAHHQGPFIVEDTSLWVEGLGGLPGPFVKWFEKAVGLDGLAKMAINSGNPTVVARSIIGYAKNNESISYYDGQIVGTIVMPRGSEGFGWDQIFVPEGYDQTFAELGQKIKNSMSMRKQAAQKLRDAL